MITPAFRNVPIRVQDFRWLIMKAEHPVTGEIFYFVDKALPFGSSRSESVRRNKHQNSCLQNENKVVNHYQNFLILANRCSFSDPAKYFRSSVTA